MKIALGQLNPKVGDLVGNLGKIREAVACARRDGADLLVLPELSLVGSPPRDLLLRRGFWEAAEAAFQEVQKESETLPLVIGHMALAPDPKDDLADPSSFRWRPQALYNAAFLLAHGTVLGFQAKRRLPSFDVFEEERYFRSATTTEILEFAGLRLGLSVGEDLWYADGVLADQAESQVDLLINVSASPFVQGKPGLRYSLGKKWAAQAGAPLIYVNLVGGQDELIFDGRSFAVRPDGQFLGACPAFAEGVYLVDLAAPPMPPPPEETFADTYQALVLGIRDYCRKNGVKTALLGLSGGIDSAVVAALACAALGPAHVLAAFLPGPHTSPLSKTAALQVAENLGIPLMEIPIEPALIALKGTLGAKVPVEGLVAENLQARIRGVLLMGLANALGAIVLCPGNKAEIALGYNTLYGDTVGALAPIGDLLKEDVYALGSYINEKAGKPVIPEEVFTRPPSAELRPNQRDVDDLPPYAQVDPCLRAILEHNAPLEELLAQFGEGLVREVLRRLHRSEYKRRQLPLVLKVTPKAFGPGWRFPVTHGFPD